MDWTLLFMIVITVINILAAYFAILNFRASKRNLDSARKLYNVLVAEKADIRLLDGRAIQALHEKRSGEAAKRLNLAGPNR